MPRLTDPVEDDQLALLREIYQGSGQGSGDWPVWQWVAGRLAQQGLDAEAIVAGLPSWQLGYGPVRGLSRGGVIEPDSVLSLTVHGLFQVGDELTLLPSFLRALAAAVTAGAGQPLHPHRVQQLVIAGPALLESARDSGGGVVVRVEEKALHDLLVGEPATWNAHTPPLEWPSREGGQGYQWRWDLTRARRACQIVCVSA